MPSDAGPALTRRISLDTVRDATKAVYRAAIRTPLVRLEVPGTTAQGPEIFLKLETLQPIGSFKIRGAQNAIAQLSPRRSSRTACGPSAPATRRRASLWPPAWPAPAAASW